MLNYFMFLIVNWLKDNMKPKCKLHKTWPAIKPKGCKVHPKIIRASIINHHRLVKLRRILKRGAKAL